MNAALIAIDLQNGWLEMSPGLKRSVEEKLSTMCATIKVFRKAGAPVIFTYHNYRKEGITPGNRQFDLFPEVEVRESDLKVVKTYQNAFNKTNLAFLLKERGCDTVVMIGLSATNCVLSTYLAAYDHDLIPYLVRGAIAGQDETSVITAERLCDTLSVRAVSQLICPKGSAGTMH
ncbi:isochorismatase family cysteine hydrolase [Methanoregula formicica]|uniref:Nicotinamidase-like amidase n=1 Tax=Methanoregula formicica (strain DSM 22288 / NBRC 105244 / SMSP) TaxID=593750 RepID=L0HF56_METFS|nr:isochorismatase family cysteine hydrolase [Methanoregula formicica]AGB01953.1 nicotinamidase-like amidase [Methanoregula formicica SMSP]